MLSDDPFESTVQSKFDSTPIVVCDECSHSGAYPKKYLEIKASSLRSDYQPSDSRLAQIGLLLAEANQDLERYSDEIAHLQHSTEALQPCRSQLQRCRDQYRYFVSPIRRIPIELWTNIFYLCCEGDAKDVDIHGDG